MRDHWAIIEVCDKNEVRQFYGAEAMEYAVRAAIVCHMVILLTTDSDLAVAGGNLG
jgi:hypothetical protein